MKTTKLTSKTEVPYIRGFSDNVQATVYEREMNALFVEEVKVSKVHCTHGPSGVQFRLVHTGRPLGLSQFKSLMEKTMGFSKTFIDSMIWEA